MSVLIRNIVPDDIPAVVKLTHEFAVLVKLSEYCEITSERLHAAMFGDESVVGGVIACDEAKPVGYALFFQNFSSFRGMSGLYLEDIYISSDYRGKGVGERMLREIARIAASRGCERIDFMVLDSNTPAVEFYEKLGAERVMGERRFKFTDEAFERLISQEDFAADKRR